MTVEQKNVIDSLRLQGLGYKKIAVETGLSENTIKSHLRRTTEVMPAALITQEETCKEKTVYRPCVFCGEPVAQNPGRREKKYCSDACRILWWNRHKYKEPRNALHSFHCLSCGKEFFAYGTSTRKYCSHACYINGRFHGGTV